MIEAINQMAGGDDERGKEGESRGGGRRRAIIVGWLASFIFISFIIYPPHTFRPPFLSSPYGHVYTAMVVVVEVVVVVVVVEDEDEDEEKEEEEEEEEEEEKYSSKITKWLCCGTYLCSPKCLARKGRRRRDGLS